MKKILSAIFNRWTLIVLGLLALCLIIWLVGPLVSIGRYIPLESETVRIVLIVLLILAVILKPLCLFIRAKWMNAQLMDKLLQQKEAAPPDQGTQEVEMLQRRFEDALQTLKHALAKDHSKKQQLLAKLSGSQYVYELPWYMFIGAPGSGKTTALVNSGLQFPLAEKLGHGAVQGIGGTRNCDWWFTNEAVLIDTAGRYTTQESNTEVDRTAWLGFLDLLKKFRPRRPINGVLVTVSIPDLLQQSPMEREAQAAAIRKRIQELRDQLQISFPIYVLVTKVDMLAGFMEFYANLGREEREQVWGSTFTFNEKGDSQAALAEFASQFSTLAQRLNDRLIDRMQQERNVQARSMLYAFPEQFYALQQPLTDFMQAVFASTRLEHAPLLRGVYFTSGTQEGSPIDRIRAGMARALNLENKVLAPQAASGKSYFLTRLVKNVVFAESALAGTNFKWERRRAWLQLGLASVAVFALALFLTMWTISYSSNKSYVADIQSKTIQAEKTLREFAQHPHSQALEMLPVLNSVRDLAKLSGTTDVPLTMQFGLAQADKLLAAADSAYVRLLQQTLLPQIVRDLEQNLRRGDYSNPELKYEQLKAYIMLTDAQRFNAEELKSFIAASWQAGYSEDVPAAQRQEMELHLAKLFANSEWIKPSQADANLLAEVRRTLTQSALPERVLNRMKKQGVGAEIPAFTVAEKGGPSAALVYIRASGKPLTEGVPGLFTYNGYYDAFEKNVGPVAKKLAEEEGWVLGASNKKPDTDKVIEEVRRLFLQEYVRIWDAFINDVKLISGNNLQQNINLARLISAADSPVPILMRAIVREVTLVKVSEAEKTIVNKANEKIASATSGFSQLFGNQAKISTASTIARPEHIVDNHFNQLRHTVQPPVPGQPAPLDASLALVNELYNQLTATQTALQNATTPPPSDVGNKMKAEAGRVPEPLRSMFNTLTSGGTSTVSQMTRQNLSNEVQANITQFCKQALNGRYPFDKTSKRDVTQEDFSRVFAPGGLMDKFFSEKLLPFADISSKPWRFREGAGMTPGANEGLEQFRRARAIRDVFFAQGGNVPSMRLTFTPDEMDAAIMQFNLDVDGQLVKYSHGPLQPTQVQWPGPKGGTQVRLQISPSTGVSGDSYTGPWALSHLFDKAHITPTGQPEKFGVVFDIGGRKAKFNITSSSVQNPFRLPEIEQFRCPERF